MIRQASGSFVGYKANDWYAVDIETAKPLFYEGSGGWVALPGVRNAFEGAQAIKENRTAEVIIHRTHLPLLTSPEALKYLTDVVSTDWASRDAWCKERGFTPRVTQHQAVDFIEPRRGVLLGDDMRTGKTLACLLSHDPARGPLVVVAPLSTRAVWLGWIKKLWPDLPVGICLGKKPKREDLEQPIVFCHYDILKHWQSARRLGTIIFDEAHFICNRNSDRARASVLVSSRAEKVICATGTPIWDMPPDLWNIIGMLAPAAWGSYFEFGMRYGDPKHNGYAVEFKGATNVEELRARLAEVKIRRLWREVKQDLPPISRNIVVADLNEPTQRKLDILAAKLKKERTNTAANLALYRSQLAKFKLGPTVKEAKKLMDAGEPVVVWTWHREFAEDIYTELEGSFLIHGEINANEREKRMDAWRKQPNAALVATMAVAQVGIDLSHSHLPIFAELDYVPAILAQTEMRTYDPNRPMNVTFIIANHVVEQRIVRALISKLNAADPLGFGAAVEAIDALREAFEGPRDDPDMDRFLEDILATEVA